MMIWQVGRGSSRLADGARMDAMDETDQTMVNTDELAGPVAEEKSTVSGIEPRGDAAAEDSGISPFILDVANPDSCEDALNRLRTLLPMVSASCYRPTPYTVLVLTPSTL